MSKGLSIVRPPTERHPEDTQVETAAATAVEVMDPEAARILYPLSDYVPILDETRSKTADPICLEVAAECDRLRVLIEECNQSQKKNPNATATIIARRLSALKLLGERMDKVEGKEQVRVELSTISSMITVVKEILRETGVAQETREIVYQKLLSRVSNLREDNKSLGM